MSVISKSIVVPCYNEGPNLPNLISRFEAIREKGADWELILVNNGSTDNSAFILREQLAKPGREFIRVETIPSPNVGYGHGIMAGLRVAKGAFLSWTHADGQTPPKDVLQALTILCNTPNPMRAFVKGNRRGRTFKDNLFTLGMQFAALLILGIHISDINAQPKAFHRNLLLSAIRPPVDLSLDLYFMYCAKLAQYDMITFSVEFGEREHGESKWALNWRSKIRNIRRTLSFMKALKTGRPYPHS